MRAATDEVPTLMQSMRAATINRHLSSSMLGVAGLYGPVIYVIGALTALKLYFLTIASLALIALVPALLKYRTTASRAALTCIPVTFPYFFLWISVSWSVAIGATAFEGLLLVAYLAQLFLFALAIERFWAQKNGLKALSLHVTVIVSCLIIIAVVVTMKYGGLRPDTRSERLAIGSISNLISSFLVIGAPFVVYWGASRGGQRMARAACILGVGGAVILLSESRAVYVLYPVAIALTCILCKSRRHMSLKRQALGVFGFASGLFMSALLLPVGDAMGVTVLRFVEQTGNDFSVFSESQRISAQDDGVEHLKAGSAAHQESGMTGRGMMYMHAWRVIREAPVLGIGYGAFKGDMRELTGRGIILHNVFLEMFIGGGAMALAAYCVVIFLAVYRLYQARRGAEGFERKDFYTVALISFSVGLAHGQVRPLIGNVFFYFPFAIAFFGYARRNFRVGWRTNGTKC